MKKYSGQILIVEDDKQIQNFIAYSLETAGLLYTTAGTGEEALKQLATETVGLILLDLGLPDFDGMEIIQKVREWSQMPIIVISARDQDKEKVAALDLGADDYLTKPFSATELLARIRVAIRHLRWQKTAYDQASLSVGNLKIQFDKRLVYLHDQEIHVTPLEYSLLSLLFQNIGKVVTTQYILKNLYSVNYGNDTQALRALMAGLRRKIEENPSSPAIS